MALVVAEVDFNTRRIVTADQQVAAITHLFDGRGCETDNHREAVVCIAGEPGRWLFIRLGDYSKRGLQ